MNGDSRGEDDAGAPTDLRDVFPEDRDDLRTALLDQIEYLIAEVEALRTVAGTVPEPVQSGRPTASDLSMKELYGLIATLDRDVRSAWIERICAEDTPELAPSTAASTVRDADWNDRAMDAVLDAVQEARRDLHARLDALPAEAWTRTGVLGGKTLTLFELVHRIAREDFERLRDLGYRLHDADLSNRDQ